MIETARKKERYILFAASTSDGDSTVASLNELKELVTTAGAETVGMVMQNREQIHPGTYLGSGKVRELSEMIFALSADGVVCDDELSPAQMKNLEDALGVIVLDRTMVILDIFAARARSGEGKLQVELAQLKYRATRLAGFGTAMSRLGGGIGTRGPGEKKLEVDRRLIRDRISTLKRELAEMTGHREVNRRRREDNSVPVAAIVGYTNAGKSTLLNAMCNADVLAENMLFATLDPTTRRMTLPDGQALLLTDTVGFIHKLPHHLIEAFHSTLEEAGFADILIHVVDASDPEREKHMQVVRDLLRSLEITGKPMITVMNKMDLCPDGFFPRDLSAKKTLGICAAKGEGLDALKETLEEIIRENRVQINMTLPYSAAGYIARVRKEGQLLEEEYTEKGIRVKAWVAPGLAGQLRRLIEG